VQVAFGHICETGSILVTLLEETSMLGSKPITTPVHFDHNMGEPFVDPC